MQSIRLWWNDVLGNDDSSAVRGSDDPPYTSSRGGRENFDGCLVRLNCWNLIYQLAVLSLIRLLHETRRSYCPFVQGHPSTGHGTSPTHSYAPLAHSYLSAPINNSALLSRANQASAQHRVTCHVLRKRSAWQLPSCPPIPLNSNPINAERMQCAQGMCL
jgi:hypothetical protein